MNPSILNLPLPNGGPIPGGLLPGRMVRVQGRASANAHSFTINLQTGPNPNDDIALNISARFTEQAIVRYSRVNGKWGVEERQGPQMMPIARDQNFEMLILSDAAGFKIAINGQHFVEFTHKILQLDRVAFFKIEGDVSAQLIQVEGITPPATSVDPAQAAMGYGGVVGALPAAPTTSGLATAPGFPPVGPQTTVGLGAAPGFTMPPAGAPAYLPPPVPGIAYPAQPYGTVQYPSPQAAGGYPGVGYPQAGYPTAAVGGIGPVLVPAATIGVGGVIDKKAMKKEEKRQKELLKEQEKKAKKDKKDKKGKK